MKKIIVTLCSLALSLAGTFGVNQLASNDEAITDRNIEQVIIDEDAEAVEDIVNIPEDKEKADTSKEKEEKSSKIEVATPKAKDTERKATVNSKSTVNRNDKKDNKKSVNKKANNTNVDHTNAKKENNVDKKKNTVNNSYEKPVTNNTVKQYDNTNNAANSNTKSKASDYYNGFKSNGNNIYVYKNVDLSNCESTQDIVNELQKNGYQNINMNNVKNIESLQDILSLIGINGSQNNNNKPTPTTVPTKPAPTTAPTKPAPTTAPTKPAPTTAPTKPAPTTPPTNNSGSNQGYADEVLRLVNIERSKAGLSSLTTNATLKAAADKRAQETEVSFSHTRPNGSKFSTALQEYGVSYRTAGENIAYGQRSPQEVVNGWMNSPGHRANILNGSFGKIGIGVYQSKGIIYWSQLFTN
jgi:uncharacterized protein YkwD